MGCQTTKLKHIRGSTGCKSIYSIMVCEILPVSDENINFEDGSSLKESASHFG